MANFKHDPIAKAARDFARKTFGITEPCTIIVLPLKGTPDLCNAIRTSDDADQLRQWLKHDADREVRDIYSTVQSRRRAHQLPKAA